MPTAVSCVSCASWFGFLASSKAEPRNTRNTRNSANGERLSSHSSQATENFAKLERMSAVVLFDGVCNFCDASVNFVIEHDPEGYFKFAPLQSDAGKQLATEYGLASETAGVEPADDLI